MFGVFWKIEAETFGLALLVGSFATMEHPLPLLQFLRLYEILQGVSQAQNKLEASWKIVLAIFGSPPMEVPIATMEKH